MKLSNIYLYYLGVVFRLVAPLWKRMKLSGQELKAVFKLSKGAKIRNRYNQVSHLTQDTNEKVKNS